MGCNASRRGGIHLPRDVGPVARASLRARSAFANLAAETICIDFVIFAIEVIDFRRIETAIVKKTKDAWVSVDSVVASDFERYDKREGHARLRRLISELQTAENLF